MARITVQIEADSADEYRAILEGMAQTAEQPLYVAPLKELSAETQQALTTFAQATVAPEPTKEERTAATVAAVVEQDEPKAKRTRKPKDEPAEAPAAVEQPAKVEPEPAAELPNDSLDDLTEAPTITLDDIRAQVNAVVSKHGPAAAKDVVLNIGKAPKISEIGTDRFADVHAALAKLLTA